MSEDVIAEYVNSFRISLAATLLNHIETAVRGNLRARAIITSNCTFHQRWSEKSVVNEFYNILCLTYVQADTKLCKQQVNGLIPTLNNIWCLAFSRRSITFDVH